MLYDEVGRPLLPVSGLAEELHVWTLDKLCGSL